MSPTLTRALADIATAIGTLDEADRTSLILRVARAIQPAKSDFDEACAAIHHLATPPEPLRETETGGTDDR